RHVDAGEDVHQRRLAAAAAAGDRHHLAPVHVQVEALQGDHLERARLVDVDEAFAVDHRAVHASDRSSSGRWNRLAERMPSWPTMLAAKSSAAAAATRVRASRVTIVGGMSSAGSTLVCSTGRIDHARAAPRTAPTTTL